MATIWAAYIIPFIIINPNILFRQYKFTSTYFTSIYYIFFHVCHPCNKNKPIDLILPTYLFHPLIFHCNPCSVLRHTLHRRCHYKLYNIYFQKRGHNRDIKGTYYFSITLSPYSPMAILIIALVLILLQCLSEYLAL